MAEPLWLFVRLPQLQLESALQGCSNTGAAAIASQRRISDCNAIAKAEGVRPGMSIANACLLVPDLQILPPQPGLEEHLRCRLGALLYRFSNQVVLHCDGAGAEVGASNRLFGSIDRLLTLLEQELAALELASQFALAPTFAAAELASRTQPGARINDLRAWLGRQPLQLPALLQRELQGIGLQCWGELLALPRAALRQRYGSQLLDYLEQLCGERSPGGPSYRPPEHFSLHLDLPQEVETIQPLLFPIRRLLRELGGFLQAKDVCISHFCLRLQGPEHQTRIEMRLSVPSQESTRFEQLIQIRLQELELQAPVRQVGLEAHELLRLAQQNHELWRSDLDREAWARLCESLRARLGEDAINQLSNPISHVPEPESTRTIEQQPHALRPVWLLDPPVPVENPCALELLSEAERIESGWWATDTRRDYFRARLRDGRLGWIYRDLKSRHWFLHGLF